MVIVSGGPVNEIGTMHPAHRDCCGCVNIRESDGLKDAVEPHVEFYCNECGKVIGYAVIPHD